MASGKLSNEGFEKIILQNCGHHRTEVRRGPAFGVDVSVIDLPGGLAMAMTSDPLSLIPSLGLQESAWLSVHLMANDMGTTGFAPMYAQMVLNLPASLSEADLVTYWSFVHQYCSEIGVAITGGHTGRIEGQNSTIAGGGTMLLTAPAESILLSCNASEGDVIVVTKSCAISSSAILAMSFPQTVINKLGRATYADACSLFYQTSSLPEALLAINTDGRASAVTAMHDVTEGGVLGAVYEMAVASGKGVQIDDDLIPISHVAAKVCALFGLDPRFSIGAGSMVMAVKSTLAPAFIEKMRSRHIEAAIIGKLTAKESGHTLITNGEATELPYYPNDAYWGAFYNAQKNEWK
ncbi:AIR synthase family protein [Pedobacter endophyticus]|uniref:AIR synthase family protein n=1 Tax=Pedobacter endophyticus TaxID=2789740 RepID=A0A7S9L1C1_9SPHI|nr:AIR synthase family protein [Pedobacter endophyticus]QPH40704.1 AIR synthase family protein [Pedobacter endophyticus]